MGLFSTESTISVTSVVYNMAGEEKDRPQYLQSLLIRNILSGTKDSIGDTIRNGYLNGPAIRFRQFFRWARKPEKYDQIGMPVGSVGSGSALSPSDVEPFIPDIVSPDEPWCQHAPVGGADLSYWAEQWIMENRPLDLDTAWFFDYNVTTNQITITFVDTTTATFTPVDFDYTGYYLYAYYIIVTNTGTVDIEYSLDHLFIYKLGSGIPELDALIIAGSDYGEFFPFIPIRVNNQFISETHYPDVFEQTKKAYKKATGGKLPKLIEELEDNPDLADIDHAYVVFGVSLNVVEMACKRYLYTFFEKLQLSQVGGLDAYNDWLAGVPGENARYDDWAAWEERSRLPGFDITTDPEPPRPNMSEVSKNELLIRSESALNTQYDTRIRWSYISNGIGTGLGRPGAKKNDCWLEYMGEDEIARNYYRTIPFAGAITFLYEKFRIYWQRDIDDFTYLDVVGMYHANYIYKGKGVLITAKKALEDAEESGFIVPLHNETWRETPIIDASQMATACVFIVFNCYEEVKQKWYETGIFRIILVIVIAIASVVFTGGAGIGLLGAHLTVGTALGFTGMTAAIVGSVVNALAALVLTTILEKVASALGIMGPVIAAILGIVIGNVISAFQAGTAFAFDLTTLFRAENLLKLTSAVGGSIQQMIQQQTIAIQEEMTSFNERAEAELKKVEEAYVSAFGYGSIDIGVGPITRIDSIGTMQSESPDVFLARTLMTGSDIVTMSQDVVYNFAEYSLKLPDAFV